MEQTIEIPADAEKVTLMLKDRCAFTLRSLLPNVKGSVELVIADEFGRGYKSDADLYKLKAGNGDSLLRKLERSRIVEGRALLELTPCVMREDPQTDSGTGCIQLWVTPPVPDEED